jgi:arabinogalactan oligomer/maltooligosaccharide transport system substrate-binding protein
MFTAGPNNLGSDVRAGLIAPIDDLVKGKLDGYTAVSIAAVTVDGKIYAVPGLAGTFGLFYNKSTIPNPPQTTNDLINLVKSGKKLGLLNNDYYLYGFWSGFGGTLMDSSGKCIADQVGFADALQYFVDLKKSGADVDTDQTKMETAFANGQLDLIIGGWWNITNFRNGLGNNLGLAPLPAGPKGPSKPLTDIDGWYISSKSTNQQAAVDFALYAFSSTGLTQFANNAETPIARSDIMTFSDPLVHAFSDYAANGDPRPQNPEINNYWGPFADMITAVLSGNTTPQSAVTTACQKMNAASNK